jgi:hypothetical protein
MAMSRNLRGEYNDDAAHMERRRTKEMGGPSARPVTDGVAERERRMNGTNGGAEIRTADGRNRRHPEGPIDSG